MTDTKGENGMERIEVITSVQRRRKFSAEEKRAMVEEAEEAGNSVSIVARKYSVNPNQLFRWRRFDAGRGALGRGSRRGRGAGIE